MNIIEDYSTGIDHLSELISSSEDERVKKILKNHKEAWEAQKKIEVKQKHKHGILEIPQLFVPHYRITGITDSGSLIVEYLTTYDV
jgi:hypothetical protein